MARKKSEKRVSAKRPARTTAASGKAAAKSKPTDRKSKTPASLPPLTGLARDLFTRVLNKIAFHDYNECCLVEGLAEQFDKTPGRLQPAIRKLVDLGYITVEGDMYPVIYPTVAALRQQDQRLTDEDARELLSRIKRA